MLLPTSCLPVRCAKVGRTVTLEPLCADLHAETLWADQEPAQWTYLFEGPFEEFDKFKQLIQSYETHAERIYFAVVNNETKKVFFLWPVLVFSSFVLFKACGFFALMNIELKHDAVEIGSVLLGLSLRRTRQATEAFFLILCVSFDEMRCRRVVWKCNSENKASFQCALRLGFLEEGLFRHHFITKGRNRDTAWLSMLGDEWYAFGGSSCLLC